MRRAWAIIVLCWSIGLGTPVAAQNPYSAAITVNNAAITHYDIEQRVMLLSALGAIGDLQAMAVEQLTEDRVKLQAGEAIGVLMPEGALEAGLDEFAAQRGIEVANVLQVLDARGIDRQTMDDFVEAGLVWREVVGARFRARAMPSEEDIDAAMVLSASTPQEVLQLAEIAIPFAERGEPETVALADRLYRDLSRGASFSAAVRQYSRSSSAERGGLMEPTPATQLPPALRSQILLMRPGQVTRPIPIGGGLAIIQLVSVRQEAPQPVAVDDFEAREALRARLFNERITSFGQGYLQELLADALIIVR
jgi:peptidyl-prolyl cis-trans isomerase SurA